MNKLKNNDFQYYGNFAALSYAPPSLTVNRGLEEAEKVNRPNIPACAHHLPPSSHWPNRSFVWRMQDSECQITSFSEFRYIR